MPSRILRTTLAAVAAATFIGFGAHAQEEKTADFVTRLERVTYRQTLRGLNVAPTTIDLLAQGDFAAAVDLLSASANLGDTSANIALLRIQHACARIVQAQTSLDPARIDKLRSDLPEPRGSRVIAVIEAQAEYTKKAQTGCRTARFDLQGIESRLRAAAEKDEPASATELARYTNDPARREALLLAAADKNYAPAQHALAQSRVVGVQRGLSTENVASIRVLLKQAGQTLPIAKLDFANCVALGCDGHPADAPTAAIFGIDAARDGEAAAFPAIMRMPWRGRLKPEEIVAWQYFGDRLNEAGCMGDAYVGAAVTFAQAFAQLDKVMRPEFVTAGRPLADKYWNDFSERAKREQLCD